jgi:hypothetical protein
MSQKDLTKDKKCIFYINKVLDSRIATAITYKILEYYYGDIMIMYYDNGFEGFPPDLWDYSYLVMIGVSPSDIGMRTIRSMVHDKNILWIDNQERNIPMWTEYDMLPGERNPNYTLTEMCWSYFHKDQECPDLIKLLSNKWTVTEMVKML